MWQGCKILGFRNIRVPPHHLRQAVMKFQIELKRWTIDLNGIPTFGYEAWFTLVAIKNQAYVNIEHAN